MTFAKDNTALRAKIEMLENSAQAANVCVLNLPIVPGLAPMEFKKYLHETLSVPLDLIPPVTKAFYLPAGKK